MQKSFDQIIETFNENVFQLSGIGPLANEEIDALQAAYNNLTGPKQDRGQANPFTPYGNLEKSGRGKFALDEKAFQIIRCKNSAEAKFGESWLRYGLEVIVQDEQELVQPFWRKNMYAYMDVPVVAGTDLPSSAVHANSLNQRGYRIVAFLGGARINIKSGMLLIEHVQKIVDNLSDVCIMTGGYRGEEGNNYGITRAGFDVPKSRGLETMVVMCEAGLGHAHQTATSRSIYGRQWGDDTPGLTFMSDAAVFFRNVPPGKNYGAWTEVEIGNFLYHGKGVAIFDPTLSVSDFPDGITSEYYFEKNVPVFRDPVALATHVLSILPKSEEIVKRPVFQIETDMQKISKYNRPFDKDLIYEDWLAVRLNYVKLDEERIINDEMKAIWVKNDRSMFRKYPDIFKFNNKEGAFEAGRDLILSGYYKDILLLQLLGKLKADDTIEQLIHDYALLRKSIENTFDKKEDKAPDEHFEWYNRTAIAGIWFLYSAEHYPNFLTWLKGIEPTEYDMKLKTPI